MRFVKQPRVITWTLRATTVRNWPPFSNRRIKNTPHPHPPRVVTGWMTFFLPACLEARVPRVKLNRQFTKLCLINTTPSGEAVPVNSKKISGLPINSLQTRVNTLQYRPVQTQRFETCGLNKNHVNEN